MPDQLETVEKSDTTAEIASRLQFLRIEAEVDGVAFSDASLADFRAFMRDVAPRSRPALFLNDNGNLRALWKNAPEEVGLQFLGDGAVQFVIFKRRSGSRTFGRVAGVDAMECILGHFKASGAEELLFA